MKPPFAGTSSPPVPRRERAGSRYTGLVVFDVDGVLYRKVFLLQLARRTGLKNYLRTLFLGLQYYRGAIRFEALVKRVLRMVRGVEAYRAREIAARIRRSRNIEQTFRLLHQEGYYISLMSAGIPDFILRDLCMELGADHYAGLNVGEVDGRLTVRNVTLQPKQDQVRSLLRELGLDWNQVVAVADDPNNVDLIRKSRLGIGFNPSMAIRRYADVVVDGYNLLELVPFIVPEDRLPPHVTSSIHSMKREVYRKFIHFLGVPLPFLAAVNQDLIFFLLLGVILVYSFSEGLRYVGFHLPVVSHVTRRARRLSEFKGFIMGPVSLTVGILASVTLFGPNAYIPAVLIVCISDSLSGLVGQRFGTRVLPCWQRTLEGSAAFYLSALAILLFFLPLGQALLLGLVPTVIELLSPHDLDNLFIPVGTALVLTLV